VVCITGNGLKTTDALEGRFEVERAVKPKLAAFDEYIREVDGSLVGAAQELVLAGGVQ
jgi:threonine synthase